MITKMKKNIVLYLVCLSMANVACYSQIIDYAQLEVKYHYEMLPNRLNLKDKRIDDAVLLIGSKYTNFYSYKNYIRDSLVEANPTVYSSQFATPDGKILTPRPGETPAEMQARGGTTIVPARSKPPINSFFRDRYFINRVSNEILCLDEVIVLVQNAKINNLSYTEILKKPVWNIKADIDTVANYRCQKASTNYGGRNWTVWFASDIPVSEGTWKLRGLPGLILKAETADGEFSLTAASVSRSTNRPIEKDEAKVYRSVSKKDMLELKKEGMVNPYKPIDHNNIEILE